MHVLVVDDESLIRWAIADVLRSAGYDVVEASTATTAVRVLEQAREPFAAILLDYSLPDSTDLRLLAKVHGLAPRSRIVFMTAFGTPDLFEHARELGACCTLDKPFDMNSLPDTIHTIAAAA